MLTQGRILVNQEVIHRAKHPLQEGDEIEVLARQRAEERTPPPQQTCDQWKEQPLATKWAVLPLGTQAPGAFLHSTHNNYSLWTWTKP